MWVDASSPSLVQPVDLLDLHLRLQHLAALAHSENKNFTDKELQGDSPQMAMSPPAPFSAVKATRGSPPPRHLAYPNARLPLTLGYRPPPLPSNLELPSNPAPIPRTGAMNKSPATTANQVPSAPRPDSPSSETMVTPARAREQANVKTTEPMAATSAPTSAQPRYPPGLSIDGPRRPAGGRPLPRPPNARPKSRAPAAEPAASSLSLDATSATSTVGIAPAPAPGPQGTTVRPLQLATSAVPAAPPNSRRTSAQRTRRQSSIRVKRPDDEPEKRHQPSLDDRFMQEQLRLNAHHMELHHVEESERKLLLEHQTECLLENAKARRAQYANAQAEVQRRLSERKTVNNKGPISPVIHGQGLRRLSLAPSQNSAPATPPVDLLALPKEDTRAARNAGQDSTRSSHNSAYSLLGLTGPVDSAASSFRADTPATQEWALPTDDDHNEQAHSIATTTPCEEIQRELAHPKPEEPKPQPKPEEPKPEEEPRQTPFYITARNTSRAMALAQLQDPAGRPQRPSITVEDAQAELFQLVLAAAEKAKNAGVSTAQAAPAPVDSTSETTTPSIVPSAAGSSPNEPSPPRRFDREGKRRAEPTKDATANANAYVAPSAWLKGAADEIARPAGQGFQLREKDEAATPTALRTRMRSSTRAYADDGQANAMHHLHNQSTTRLSLSSPMPTQSTGTCPRATSPSLQDFSPRSQTSSVRFVQSVELNLAFSRDEIIPGTTAPLQITRQPPSPGSYFERPRRAPLPPTASHLPPTAAPQTLAPAPAPSTRPGLRKKGKVTGLGALFQSSARPTVSAPYPVASPAPVVPSVVPLVRAPVASAPLASNAPIVTPIPAAAPSAAPTVPTPAPTIPPRRTANAAPRRPHGPPIAASATLADAIAAGPAAATAAPKGRIASAASSVASSVKRRMRFWKR